MSMPFHYAVLQAELSAQPDLTGELHCEPKLLDDLSDEALLGQPSLSRSQAGALLPGRCHCMLVCVLSEAHGTAAASCPCNAAGKESCC